MTNKKNKLKLSKKAVKKEVKREVRQMTKPKATRARRSGMGGFLRTAGKIAGGIVGNPMLGEVLGAGVSKIFGQGAYSVNAVTQMPGPPTFADLGASKRIQHREYLGDLFSNTGFNNSTYAIQPADGTTFPWLSQIAKSFEQYSFKGLVFYLNTTSGNAIASTNNALGVWGAVTVYDASAPALMNKRQCEDYMGCTASVPACSILHAVECKPGRDVLDRYYVLNGQDPDVGELKFFNQGTLNVFVQGQQASNVNLGELWVSYDIEFYNPRIDTVGTNLADHFQFGGLTVTNATPLGAVPLSPVAGSNLGSTINTITQQVTIPAGAPAGNYIFMANYSNPSFNLTNPLFNLGAVSGGFGTSIFLNDTVSKVSPGGLNVGIFTQCNSFSKTAAVIPLVVQYNTATLPTAAGGVICDLYIIGLPQLMISEIPKKFGIKQQIKEYIDSLVLPKIKEVQQQHEEEEETISMHSRKSDYDMVPKPYSRLLKPLQ
jgi:hypothetical protein